MIEINQSLNSQLITEVIRLDQPNAATSGSVYNRF